ncbi:MAG: hypothetical protein H0V12_09685, partial [Chloroflexi bacterium]|nr:hypothetical protein [Chloroflexota bacterium]
MPDPLDASDAPSAPEPSAPSSPSAHAPSAPAPSAPGAAAPGAHLGGALAFAPAHAPLLLFTDWALIRQYEGLGEPGQGDREEDQIALGSSIAGGQTAPSTFAFAELFRHAEVWGWDTTDLQWEATIGYDDGPLYVLHFPDGFNLAAVEARFVERGFERAEHRGWPLYSSELDLSADWLTGSELSIVNTAILADQQTLVISRSPENVLAALDARADTSDALLGQPGAREAAEQLGGVAGAALQVGLETCDRFFPSPTFGRPPQDSFDLLERLAELQLAPYEALALGYRYDGERAVGLVAMRYGFPFEESAELDLLPRAEIAETGLSALDGEPYSDRLELTDYRL